MARYDLYIPEEVKRDIKTKLASGIADTLLEFVSAEEEEDTLTGHLLGKLTTRDRKVYVEAAQVKGYWSWSLFYRKFRGRGPKATENVIGADGIFEMHLSNGAKTETKSLLFQSKIGQAGNGKLVEQCAKLSTWREAAVVLIYDQASVEAITLDQVLANKGSLSSAKRTPLDSYIADQFVACKVGDNDLRYYPQQRVLVWKDERGQLVAANFMPRHRVRISIKPPGHSDAPPEHAVKLQSDGVHKHRMESKFHERLGLDPNPSPKEIKSAQRMLSKIYHPDLWQTYSDEFKELMKARTQELFEGD